MSSAPSQVASQGMIAQPKPTPAQLAATVAKPLPVLTQPAATVTNPPTVSNSSTMIRKPTAAKPEPQREKSSLSGFRLPGQSSVMVASKQEATKKVTYLVCCTLDSFYCLTVSIVLVLTVSLFTVYLL